MTQIRDGTDQPVADQAFELAVLAKSHGRRGFHVTGSHHRGIPGMTEEY